MKMEIQVTAPTDGTIQEIKVNKGDHVTNGQELATIA